MAGLKSLRWLLCLPGAFCTPEFPLWLPQATMKNDKNHGRDAADCRAELILINGDCTSSANSTPALLLEANGKPSTPGESGCAVPGVYGARDPPAAIPRASRGLQHGGHGQDPSMALAAQPGRGNEPLWAGVLCWGAGFWGEAWGTPTRLRVLPAAPRLQGCAGHGPQIPALGF